MECIPRGSIIYNLVDALSLTRTRNSWKWLKNGQVFLLQELTTNLSRLIACRESCVFQVSHTTGITARIEQNPQFTQSFSTEILDHLDNFS